MRRRSDVNWRERCEWNLFRIGRRVRISRSETNDRDVALRKQRMDHRPKRSRMSVAVVHPRLNAVDHRRASRLRMSSLVTIAAMHRKRNAARDRLRRKANASVDPLNGRNRSSVRKLRRNHAQRDRPRRLNAARDRCDRKASASAVQWNGHNRNSDRRQRRNRA